MILFSQGIKEEGGKASFGHSFVSGCVAATTGSLIVNPIDGEYNVFVHGVI